QAADSLLLCFHAYLPFPRRRFFLTDRDVAFHEAGVLGGYLFQPGILYARYWAALLFGAARDTDAAFGQAACGGPHRQCITCRRWFGYAGCAAVSATRAANYVRYHAQ